MRVEILGGVALDLTDDQVDDLREQLGISGPSNSGGMLTTAQAAERLGFSPEYVRDHAVELGGRKMGEGPKAQWRFPAAQLSKLDDSGATNDAPVRDRTPARRRAPRRAGTHRILQSRG